MSFKHSFQHSKDVERIKKNLCELRGKPITLAKDTLKSNTTRNGFYKKNSLGLNCRSLNSILSIDPGAMIAIVEPNVTFKKLCLETEKFGLVPEVVPEFESITVGGAIMGAAIESSSHKYGQFNDGCLEYELLLGNGELIIATPEQNSDLFFAVSGSYGTLALLMSAKIKLVPASKYVVLNVQRFKQSQPALDYVQSLPKVDFIESIALSPNDFLVITGHKSNEIKGRLYKQKNYWHPWFYSYIGRNQDQYITMNLQEYFFRHNRGAFWMGKYLLRLDLLIRAITKTGLSTITQGINTWNKKLNVLSQPSILMRLLFGSAYRSQYLYRLWHQVPKQLSENTFMVQDFYIPFSKIQQAAEYFNHVGIFPIWLCPVKATKTAQILSPSYVKNDMDCDYFLNFGVYGIPKTNKQSIPQLTQEIEQDIAAFSGKKMLYSHSYYSKDLFKSIYNLDLYYFLRKKYHAESFMTLYQKIID